MSLLLLVLGIVLAAAGAAAIGFGIPINALPLGATLITAGTTALVGGLLLVGLSAAVSELSKMTVSLKAGPVVRPASAKVEPSAVVTVSAGPLPARDPVPIEPIKTEPQIVADARSAPAEASAPTPPVQVSASAIERLRSTIPRAERSVPLTEGVPLSPNGQQQHQAEPAPAEPQPRPAGADVTQPAAREPRLDFLFRSRQGTRPSPQPQSESFDAMWPKRSGRGAQVEADRKAEPRVEPRLEPAPAVEESRVAPPVINEPAPAEPAPPAPAPSTDTVQPPVAILKSGVVDGMAYTLYADGSIEAQLPQGTVRFGSIAELRAHIENNS